MAKFWIKFAEKCKKFDKIFQILAMCCPNFFEKFFRSPPSAAPEKKNKRWTLLFFRAAEGNATIIEGLATIREGNLKGKSSGPEHDATIREGRQLER